MSVSLVLVFDHYGFTHGPLLAFERVRLDWQNYDGFDRLAAEAVPYTKGVMWYGDAGLESATTIDSYGDELKYVTAYTLERHLSNVSYLSAWDKAVLAFISALPADTQIVLWWN
jgi:hypothetical protein